jgi:co-chaperonin GroES (HSP10)
MTMSHATMQHLKMQNEWIFVRALEDFEEKDGKLVYPKTNIVVPDVNQGFAQKAVILRIGEKIKEKNIHVDDQILFKRRAGFKAVMIDGQKVLVMKPEQILAVIFGEHVTDVNPLKDTVFLEWEESPEFYPGTTIRKPDSFRKLYFTGIIRAKGPDVTEMEIGDRVFFDQFGGVEKFQEDGKRYGFIAQDAIYCTGVPMREEEGSLTNDRTVFGVDPVLPTAEKAGTEALEPKVVG